MEHLVFRLYAPLASYGEIAVGEVRRSSSYPSKSAVVGIMGAALGIRREEEEKYRSLFSMVSVGVKVLNVGSLLKDFQTIQVPSNQKKVLYYSRADELNVPSEKLNTVLSYREYRCDAASIVSVWLKSGSPFSLNDLKKALLHPVFCLYAGRKSCPFALPLQPEIIEEETLKKVFDRSLLLFKDTWFDIKDIINFSDNFYYWEDHPSPGLTQQMSYPRYDSFLSKKPWQFTSRTEFMGIGQEEEN